MNYSEFFRCATGKDPFPYQEKLATSKQAPHTILKVPTGAGKTAAIVLGWLWRRLYGSEGLRQESPARLVYCLPMRALVDQTHQEAKRWLANVGIDGSVGLEKLMGGEAASEWFLSPERSTIVIGTQDMLLSRALNRGYGSSRYRWPIEFGLLNNDSLWALDEVQLMGDGLASTTQLAAFRQKLGVIGSCRTIWMSATLNLRWFESIDMAPFLGSLDVKSLEPQDHENTALKARLNAVKKLEKTTANQSNHKALAKSVLEAHQGGTLTLAVLNTVDRAKQLYEDVKTELATKMGKINPLTVLLHSRFRPEERRRNLDRLLNRTSWPADGLIVVTTQVIEAGVDVSAKTLFTELAPLPSMVQRFGRCNRFGEYSEAAVYWIDILAATKGKIKMDSKSSEKIARPYRLDDIEAASRFIEQCDNVGPAQLDARISKTDAEIINSLFSYEPEHVIRKKDLMELFDTTPDLAGNDMDVSRFIREGDEQDVQVFWREFPPTGPSADMSEPEAEELCSVPLYAFREFIMKESLRKAYRWDPLSETWALATPSEMFPGQVYLTSCAQGGYDTDIGWNPLSKQKVVSVHEVKTETKTPDDYAGDELSSQQAWQRICEHSDGVVEELHRLLKSLNFEHDLTEFRESLIEAGRWHDRGKSHSVFSEAIVGTIKGDGLDWAKAPAFRKYGRKGFRHELASALAMLQANKPDLACYLAAAHHGKVRLSIRSLPIEAPPDNTTRRFARGIHDGDRMPSCHLGGGVIAPEVTLSLEPMEVGMGHDGKPSWADRMLGLRNDPNIGPFRLGMLEALLRIADILASKTVVNRQLPDKEQEK